MLKLVFLSLHFRCRWRVRSLAALKRLALLPLPRTPPPALLLPPRLLRSSEAFARAATAALLAPPRPEARVLAPGYGAADGDVKAMKKKRSSKKKKKYKQVAMEGVLVGPLGCCHQLEPLPRLRQQQPLLRPCPGPLRVLLLARRRASWLPGPLGSALRVAPACQLQPHLPLHLNMFQFWLALVLPLLLRIRL